MHTRGPWTCTRLNDPQYYVFEIANGEGRIASVVGWTTFGTACPITESNARLITHAPELVDAIKELLRWHDMMGGWDAPCWERARRIHAEAVGTDMSAGAPVAAEGRNP